MDPILGYNLEDALSQPNVTKWITGFLHNRKTASLSLDENIAKCNLSTERKWLVRRGKQQYVTFTTNERNYLRKIFT